MGRENRCSIPEYTAPKYKAHFTLVDPTPDIGLYNAGADLYLLTSREDPFPNVVLEALDAKLPVIGFKMLEVSRMLLQKNWCLSRFLNLPKMLEKIYEFIHDEGLRLQREALAKNLSKKLQFS